MPLRERAIAKLADRSRFGFFVVSDPPNRKARGVAPTSKPPTLRRALPSALPKGVARELQCGATHWLSRRDARVVCFPSALCLLTPKKRRVGLRV
ncbi:MAG: hypothetical protein F6K28_60785 [Microcoleus sp. SIO2G3]|nr:hypothetical protein [Microcoleus sp. SIO2G3]